MGLFAQGFSGRFWSLIGAVFLGFLGIGAVLPGMGPHLRQDLGGSDLTVGFVIGIFSFVAGFFKASAKLASIPEQQPGWSRKAASPAARKRWDISAAESGVEFQRDP